LPTSAKTPYALQPHHPASFCPLSPEAALPTGREHESFQGNHPFPVRIVTNRPITVEKELFFTLRFSEFAADRQVVGEQL
jgi:hypothetical protein